MKINKKELFGNWEKGYALDKHVLNSTFLGNNEHGHPTFDTTRSEIGEATYQLKYKQNWSMVEPLAQTLANLLTPNTQNIGLIIPVPASKKRLRQPVFEIASTLAAKINIPYFETIVTTKDNGENNTLVKNLNTKEEKTIALSDRFQLNEVITNQGLWNALIIDDIYDSGASLEATCGILRKYAKINNIYVLTLTWK